MGKVQTPQITTVFKQLSLAMLLMILSMLSYQKVQAQTNPCCDNITITSTDQGNCNWSFTIDQFLGGPGAGCPPIASMQVTDVGYTSYPATPNWQIASYTGQANGSGTFSFTFYDAYGNIVCTKEVPYTCNPEDYGCEFDGCGPYPYGAQQTKSVAIPGSSCQMEVIYRTRNQCLPGSMDMKIESFKITPQGCASPMDEQELIAVVMMKLLSDNTLTSVPNAQNPDLVWRVSMPDCFVRDYATGKLVPCPGSGCCLRRVASNYDNTTGNLFLSDLLLQDPGTCVEPNEGLIRKSIVTLNKYFPTSTPVFYLTEEQLRNYFPERYPTTYLTPEQLVDPLTRTLNTAYPVGAPHELSVSPTGGVGFQLPIFTPPGTNGMQPAISLVYNSQSSNGIAGWGWSISGMSSISRIGKDLFHEGTVEQFKNQMSDNLVLDGNRLILTSGTGTEGTLSAEYGTEVGNTVKIVPIGVANDNNGYTAFEVHTKEGNKIQYGEYDSQVKIDYQDGTTTKTCVVQWLIKRIIDPNGNFIQFNYDNNYISGGSEVWLRSIEYTGNVSQGLLPYASIDFKYSKRADQNRKFIGIAGAVVNTNSSSILDGYIDETLILGKIEVKYEGKIVHQYELKHFNHPKSLAIYDGIDQTTYSYDTKDYSFLSEIIEYGEGNNRHNSNIFTYFDKESIETAIKHSTAESNGIAFEESDSEKSYVFGDFNGDGIQDRMVVEHDYDENFDLDEARWFLQTGSFFECTGTNLDCGPDAIFLTANNNNPMFRTKDKRLINYNYFSGYWELLVNQTIAADINNDGKDELIIPYWWQKEVSGDDEANWDKLNFKVYSFDGTSFNNVSNFQVENWDGSFCNLSGRMHLMEDLQFQVGDFNGDRYLEMIIKFRANDFLDEGFPWDWEPGGLDKTVMDYVVLTDNSGAFLSNPTVQRNKICLSGGNGKIIAMPHDIDMKTDLLVFDGNNASIYGLSSNGAFESKNISINNINAGWEYRLGDLNGDGLVDLVYCKTDGNPIHNLYYRYNTGNSYTQEYRLRDFVPYGIDLNSFNVADFNGDGKSDIFVRIIMFTGYTKYQMYFSTGFNKFDCQIFTPTYAEAEPYLNPTQIYDKKGYRYSQIMDFNGDGKSDLFNRNGNSGPEYIITFYANKKNLLLKSLSDGLGNLSQGNYDAIAAVPGIYTTTILEQNPLRTLLSGMYLASKMEKFSYKQYTEPISSYSYDYRDGLAHNKKGFLGFREFWVKSIVSENQYLLTKTKQELDLTKYIFNIQEVKSFIYTRPTSTSSFVENLLSTTTVENSRTDMNLGRYFHYQSKITQEDALTGIKKTTLNDYDDWGNLEIQTIKYGNPSTPRATETFTTTYTNPGTWCNSKPSSVVKTSTHADESGIPYTQKVNYEYYGNLKNYNVHKIINQPNVPNQTVSLLELISIFDYDGFGNVTSSIKTQTAHSIADREKRSIYDSRGRFILENWEVSALQAQQLQYVTKNTYNGVYGHILTSKDFQGLTTTHQYDGFGRETSTTDPVGAITNFSLQYNPITTEHPTKLFYKGANSAADPDTKTFYRSNGREVKIEKESFDGRTEIIEKEYYNDGRLKKQYYPYFLGSTKSKHIEYSYDTYLRPWKASQYMTPGNLPLQTTTTYSGKTTTTVDPNGKSTSKTIDDLGNLISTYETIIPSIGSNPGSGNTITYTYYASGKVHTMSTGLLNIDGAEHTIEYKYDIYGNKIEVRDLDFAHPGSNPNTAGAFTFEYNAFGEMIIQATPKGREEYKYDVLGRMIENKIFKLTYTNHDFKIEKTYVDAGTVNGSGKLASIIMEDNTGSSPTVTHKVEIAYDSYGRQNQKKEYVGSSSKLFTKNFTYNTLSKLATEEYPTGVKAGYTYNAAGQLTLVKRIDGSFNQEIWKLNDIDAMGKTKEIKLDNGGITTQYGYNVYELPSTIATNAGTTEIQDLEFNFDASRRVLTSRADNKNSQTESFLYDALYRLTQYTVNSAPACTLDYHNDGSIAFKSDVGEYKYTNYGSTSNVPVNPPHGVKRVGGAYNTNSPYQLKAGYKPNGNYQELSYNSFNRVDWIEESQPGVSEYKTEFLYNSNRQRARTTYYLNSINQYDKYYLDGYEEIAYTSGNYKRTTYIQGANGIVAAIIQEKIGTNTPTEQTVYIHTDYLGSIQSLSKANGMGGYTIVGEFAYDPWGRLRHANNWENYYASENDHLAFGLLGRGFTGHEHMPEYGLINMNARLYDPFLAQFFSPDNTLQAPDNSQNFNRFSYGFNNPMSYTDPDGNVAWFIPVLIGAALFGTGNAVSHAIRGDINNGWDFLKYFGQGAIVGAALGAGYYGAAEVGGLLKTVVDIYVGIQLGTTGISAGMGLIKGIATDDWSLLSNAGDIFLGNFYIDEQKNLNGQTNEFWSFFEGVFQGISRHTWEMPQVAVGYGLSQIRNSINTVDRVEFFGGATFAIDERNPDGWGGVSLGNNINISMADRYSSVTNHYLLMHEYGHTFDSQALGFLYLFGVGLPSFGSAAFLNSDLGNGLTAHDIYPTERRANRNAARYFRKYYGVPWNDKDYPR